jgi:hypothetical protein
MFQFQMKGFEHLTSRLKELSDALNQLNGKLCEVRFDPSRPDQVQTAIRTMERAVNERLSEFPDNPLVQQLAAGIKQRFKQEMLNLASEAQRQLALNQIPFDPLNNSAFLGGTASTLLRGWSSAGPTRRRLF